MLNNLVISSLESLLGFDTALILNLGIALAACSTIFHYTRELLLSVIRYYCTSSVEIKGFDPVYAYIVRWMTIHQVKMTSKTVQATAMPQNTEEDYEDSPLFREYDLKNNRELNKANCSPVSYRGADKLPIRFLPSGTYTFWHRGSRFVFQQSTREREKTTSLIDDLNNVDDIIKLDCWGQSLGPIRDLLKEAQAEFLEARGSGTRVFRSAAAGGSFQWKHITLRPARDMNTIIMDDNKKQALVNDMNEYLLVATRKWYAAHGIPYRRGYLFSGMPGTGKTSLAFALAGVFGLSIYSISLADPDMVESELVNLFSTLPKRCVVLLEEIDAAGIKRNGIEGCEPGLNRTTARQVSGSTNSNSHKGLSLSGLLNAIDGVASQEGRVLIMTTNIPDALDPASIRPGRIDMRVHFEYATRSQIRELFISMYRDMTENTAQHISSVPVADEKSSLPALADDFAAMLPPGRLSMAAVQGYLIHYKHNPREAVLNAESWLKARLCEG